MAEQTNHLALVRPSEIVLQATGFTTQSRWREGLLILQPDVNFASYVNVTMIAELAGLKEQR
jgi:hypothetical protein